MKIVFLVLLIVMNVVSFAAMWIDKRKAIHHKERIPEKTLFLLTACFGGLGGTWAMMSCRHKTRHWYFRVFFPLMLILQTVILVWLWIRFGAAL